MVFNDSLDKTPNMVCSNINGEKKYINSIWGGINNSPILLWAKNKPLKCFAVVNQAGEIYSSIDGIVWEYKSKVVPNFSSSSTSEFHISYGNGRFVCTCDKNKKAYYSVDLINWIECGGSIVNVKNIAYGNGKFVCVGSYGSSYELLDKSNTWKYIDGLTRSDTVVWDDIIYANNKFICCSNNDFTNYYDEVTYKKWLTYGKRNEYKCIISGNGQLVGVGYNAFYNTNDDGLTWKFCGNSPILNSNDSFLIVYGNDTFICINKNTGRETVNGKNIDLTGWTDYYSLSCTPITDVCYANNIFLVAGSRGILYSTDGIKWNYPSPQTSWYAQSIAHSFV